MVIEGTSRARQVFVARCVRSGDWWSVSIDDAQGVHVRGANTQAKRLDHVEGLVREVISVLLDVDEDAFDVRLDVELPEVLRAEVDLAKDLRQKAEMVQRQAMTATAQAAADLVRRQGLTIREASRILGLSHQRIGQLLEEAPSPV